MVRIIYYDISEAAARTRVHDYLEAQGFDRIQYSVFIGEIDPHRWQKVWAHLVAVHCKHCQETDKIYSHVIERDHFRKMAILGRPLDVAWILQELDVWFA